MEKTRAAKQTAILYILDGNNTVEFLQLEHFVKFVFNCGQGGGAGGCVRFERIIWWLHIALEYTIWQVLYWNDNAPSVENVEKVCCVYWYSLGSKVLHDCITFDSEIHGFWTTQQNPYATYLAPTLYLKL